MDAKSNKKKQVDRLPRDFRSLEDISVFLFYVKTLSKQTMDRMKQFLQLIDYLHTA